MTSGSRATLLLVATRPVPPGLVDQLATVAVRRRRYAVAVARVAGDGLELVDPYDPRAVDGEALPGGSLPALTALVRDVLSDVDVPAVLLAPDRLARHAAWGAVRETYGVLAVHTPEAVLRVLAALERGVTVDELLHPPPFSVERSLGHRPGGATGALRLVERVGAGARAEWLGVGRDAVDVRADLLEPAPRAGVLAALDRGDAPPVATTSPGRLAVGPANGAGQGWQWARAVREHLPGWSAANVHVHGRGDSLAWPAHLPLDVEEWQDASVRVDVALGQLLGATHVLVEAMRPLLAVGEPASSADAHDPELARGDVEALLRSGRQVAVVLHGAEARRHDVQAHLTPWFPAAVEWAGELVEARRRETGRVHRALDGFAGPRFVAALDLLDHVAGARWLPPVVPARAFDAAEPALRAARPVVAHVPSLSALDHGVAVDETLARLDERGLVVYRRLVGVPPVGMPRALRSVDIVVDSLTRGGPAVLAAEAMAAGRLVVGHAREAVRGRVAAPLPVVEARPDTLEHVLVGVLEDRERYAAVAAAGVAFAREHHDGRLSARVLAEEFLR